MTIFFNLFTNLLPLYALIGAGFLYGRYLRIDIQTLINLVLYLFIPVVVFGFVARVEMQPAYVLLPILVFGISCAIGFSMLRLGRAIYGDSQANVLSMCTAMGNLGYFGLPLVFLLFEEKWVGVYMFMLIGGVLYEATAGYYIAARGAFTVRDSLIKVLKFPSIYALLAGMMVNYAGVALPEAFWTYWTYAKGGYVIIGMMIIGAALSKTPRLAISPRFLSLVFLGKFVLWPLLASAFVMADRLFLHIFEVPVLELILVASLVPPAANIAAFTAQFGVSPEKAATTILLMTAAAIFYIPLALMLLRMQ